MRTTCVFCGCQLDNEKPGVYQRVTGWERNRTQGGTNAIRLPQRTPEWACHPCIDARVNGLEHQAALFP